MTGLESHHHELIKRELEVLKMLASGCKSKDVATALGVSASTVAFHIRNIYKALNVSTRVSALRKAHEWGIIIWGA